MNEMKRVLALLLCVVMLVGVMPVGALAAEAETTAPSEALEVQAAEAAAAAATTEAAEIETSVPETTGSEAEEAAYYEAEDSAVYATVRDTTGLVDAAIFGSDIHEKDNGAGSSALADVMGGIAGNGVPYSVAGFAGDNYTDIAGNPDEDFTPVIREALGIDEIVGLYSYGNHDSKCDIEDFTGLLYGDDKTNFYVYAISQSSMASSSPDTSGFTTAVEAMDHTKPLFILSHVPMHNRRGDNNGASAWYTAISAAAEQMDIVFFWGHNHTSESSADTDAYYVAKDGSEQLKVYNGTSAVPNFTYMNAGYIYANGQNPARIGVATTVEIYKDTMVFQDYNSSGEYTGSYAHNVEVAREFASEEEETTDPTESTETTEPEVVVPDYLEVTGTTTYTVGDDLTMTIKGIVYSPYSSFDIDRNDCEITINCPDGHACTMETVMDTVTAEGDYHQVTVAYPGVADTQVYSFTVGAAEVAADEATGVSVAVNPAIFKEISVAESANENVAGAMEKVSVASYKAYDITPTDGALQPGNYATVTLPIPEGVENPVVYYVSDDGLTVTDMKAEDNGDGTVSFVTDHFSIYAVGEAGEEAEKDLTLGTTTTTTKTVYVLTSSISANSSYLIVNGNGAGSYYALANNSGSVAATGVTVKTDSAIGTYIELDDATDELWTFSGSSSTSLKNGSYYLTYSGSRGNYSLDLSTSSTSWSRSGNTLSIVPNRTTYYVVYDSGWDFSSSSDNVYFYVPTEVEVTVDNSTTYTVSASDITHIYDTDSTTADTAALTYKLLANGAEATGKTLSWSVAVVSDPDGILNTTDSTNETLVFTGKTGEAKVRVYCEWTEDGATQKAWTTITVKTTEPYYSIELHKANVADDGTVTVGDLITAPVALKKIKVGDTYSVWAVVKEHTSTDPDGADLGDVDDDRIKWSVSNNNIAIVDPATGVITFTGEEYGTFELTATYLDENGEPLCEDTITISVSENAGVVPGDGTNDFPEYPNEGAVRINKTADALGNFSETGIAKVELSMTGVPYTTGSEIDVVIMMDMTGSMSDDAMAAAEEAAIAFAESIVKNEDGTYNNNRISVMAFNSSSSSPFTYWEMGTVSADEWESFCTEVRTASDDQTSGGTPYDEALAKCQEVLAAAKKDGIGDNRQQFCVFMSDGGPTSYAYITNYDAVKAGTATEYTYSSATATGGANQSDSNFATIATYTHERYSTLMKDDGITMYSVLTGLVAANYPNCTTIMQNIASDTEKAYVVEDGTDTEELSGVLAGIGLEIKQAATNVNVTDEIGNDYTLNFSLPGDVTKEAAGMDEFDIQVVEYTLDSDHERDGDPAVLENFTFNADGTLKSHTVDGTACSSCSHVTLTNGVVTAINGTYFQYEVKTNTDGTTSEFLYWHSDKLTNKELALQYYAYLDNSAGESDPNNQVPAGSYYTNEEAIVTYTNFQGNECELEFPKPQMTWSGAQVTYRFYLVDKYGNPVNRAGKVIPFAEAITVYQSEPIAVTWNSLNEGESKMLAQDLLANDKVPGVYSLYDENAYYEIRVYQTEGVDDNGANYNYFIIEGSDQDTLNEARGVTGASLTTTKVYNTVTSGIRYVNYGAYSETSKDANGNNFTPTSARSGKSYTPTITNNIDYANTTVAFGVLWTPSLAEDTIIVDYGLDVEVDVSINDMVETQLVGVRNDKPDAAINTGVVASPAKTTSANITIGDDDRTIGTAKVLNNAVIQFSLNKPTDAAASNAMLFDEPAVVYYESMYTWLNGSNYVDDVMYSSLTVIPASTVYYEDEYVTLKTFTAQKDDEGNIVRDDEGKIVYSETAGWDTNSKAATATQAVDRPGTTANMENVEDWDANNNYGYDDAYGNCATYSMDNAAMINVTKEKYGTASFDFYGTGFDVISSTSSDTGTLVVTVTHVENGETVTDRNLVVNTYYGYKLTNQYMFYVYTKDGWIYKGHSYDLGFAKEVDTLPEDVEISNQLYAIYGPFWVPAADGTDGLFQIPVMKVTDLPYGKYSVTITAGYNRMLDIPGDGNYDLYLDAIRIYDPTGVVSGKTNNTTVSNAYKADGEGWAKYSELRDIILAAGTFGEGIDSAAGAVFIDHDPTGTNSITDYAAYGPNNELYLTSGQTAAFILDPSLQYSSYDLADVQIGLKSADKALGEVYATLTTYTESNGTYTSNSSTAPIEPIAAGTTATDRYYSIGTHVNKTGETILSIQNTGSGILSITNIKLTFNAPPVEKEDGISLFAMTRSVADGILLAMNTADNAVEEPEEVPDAELNVSLNKQSVKVGGSVQVKVTTSADVDALSVNGQEITKFKQNNKTGKRTWTVKVTAEDAGDLDIEVIAKSADGKTLDSVVETVEVTAKKSGNVNKTVGQLLGKLFG